MDNLIEKLRIVHDDLRKSKGEFLFFGFFKRFDKNEMWDLVVAADWIRTGKTREVVKSILDEIKDEDLAEFNEKIEAIVVMSPDEEFTKYLADAFKTNSYESEGDDFKIVISKDLTVTSKVISQNFEDFNYSTIRNHQRDEIRHSGLVKKTAVAF